MLVSIKLYIISMKDDIFFSIGKVAKMVSVAGHTIRFWQQQFPQIKYKLGKGNRKYYTIESVNQFLQIKNLMYEKGMKIAGIQKMLLSESADAGLVFEVKIEPKHAQENEQEQEFDLLNWIDLKQKTELLNNDKDNFISNILLDIKSIKSLLKKIK